MPTPVEDIMESTATGVLRALEACREGVADEPISALDLVRAGFNVSIVIRPGGMSSADLNPQPLPPGPGER